MHPETSDGTGRPRILVIAESLPYPTLKGGDLRTWQNLNALASYADVGIFGLCSNDVRRERPPDLPLAFWTTSSDPALAYPPPQGVRLAARAWLLDPLGHPSDLYESGEARAELEQRIAGFRPDIVIAEGLWVHRYLQPARTAGCRCILDCHNVEAALVRELSSNAVGPGLEGRVRREVLPARTEIIEARAVRAADELWVCSVADERRLRTLYAPAAPVHVVPNAIRVGDYAWTDRTGLVPCQPPLTLLFTAFFPYAPNAVAARFLVEEIGPRLAAECIDYRLQLVGAQPSDELKAAAAADARIDVTGAVRDIRPSLAAATALAVPLFHGGGTRLKVLEAFAAGLPVIATAKAVEGLDVHDGEHVLIAEDADAFVAAAVALWCDPGHAARLAAAAHALVEQLYSWESVGARIRGAVGANRVSL